MAAPALTAFVSVLRRDLLLAFRHRGELVNPLIFFVLVVSLFPLAVGPESRILQTIGPGVIWVGALLASLLSLDTLFRSDFEDGALEQLALTPQPFALLVFAKVLVHWLISGLPVLLLSPLLGLLLYLPTEAMPVLLWTLLLGTPVLSLVGAIGVALTVSLRRGGLLLSLLLLPLWVPVLIFAAGAVNDAAAGIALTGQYSALGTLLALALTLAPLTISAALRASMSA